MSFLRRFSFTVLASLSWYLSGYSAPAAADLLPVTGVNKSMQVQKTATDIYILGPGDQLELSFLGPAYSKLGGSFDILNDGTSSLPLLGAVQLDGLTLNQAKQWLESLYAAPLRRPALSLRLLKPRPMQVSVVGEVRNPGLYLLTPGGELSAVQGIGGGGQGNTSSSIPGLPTLVTALQKAGGLSLTANLADVRIRRRIPGNSTQLRETSINLISLLDTGDKRQNPFLFDGDTIVVSSAPVPAADRVLDVAAANLSPQTITVNVIGELKSPGRIQLPAGTPLVQAVLAAGGPIPMRASKSNVELVRINRNGTAVLRRYNLDYNLGVSGSLNPPLRNGDTIIVNRNGFAAVTDSLNALSSPLGVITNAFGVLAIIDSYNNDNK
jgi:polysaccharide export outer membrane protein